MVPEFSGSLSSKILGDETQIFQPMFDVAQIILDSDHEKQSTKGAKVLQECVETSLTTFAIKNLIKRRIVSNLVKAYTYYPPMLVKQNMAQCVATQLFPNLNEVQKLDIKNLFYSESKVCKNKAEGGAAYKRIPASGLIEDRLKYVRRKNDVHTRRKLVQVADLATDEDPGELEKKSWLSYSTAPQSQVENYMDHTYQLRSQDIRMTKNLRATLAEWPRLLDTPGMVDQDFRKLQPGKEELMLRKWPIIASQICAYAQKTKPTVFEEIEIIPSILEWTPEQMSVGALLILPYVTASSAYSLQRNKRRKLTGANSAAYFVQFVSPADDLECLRNTESKRKQPFVVCVGDIKTLYAKDSYVLVEDKLVAAASLVNAVDLCFKTFHVLQVKFPEECFPVWSFFDHSVFKIHEIASPPASVLSLGSQINV